VNEKAVILKYFVCPFCGKQGNRTTEAGIKLDTDHLLASCLCPSQHRWCLLVDARQNHLSPNDNPPPVGQQLTVASIFGDEWRKFSLHDLHEYLDANYEYQLLKELKRGLRSLSCHIDRLTSEILLEEIADLIVAELAGQIKIRQYGSARQTVVVQMFASDSRLEVIKATKR